MTLSEIAPGQQKSETCRSSFINLCFAGFLSTETLSANPPFVPDLRAVFSRGCTRIDRYHSQSYRGHDIRLVPKAALPIPQPNRYIFYLNLYARLIRSLIVLSYPGPATEILEGASNLITRAIAQVLNELNSELQHSNPERSNFRLWIREHE